MPTPRFLGFPGGSAGKESVCHAGRPGFDPWVGKIPWRRERLPTPVVWAGEFRGLQSMGSQRVGTEYRMAVRINDLVSPEVISKSPRHNETSRTQKIACYLGLCLYQYLAQATLLFIVIGVSMW